MNDERLAYLALALTPGIGPGRLRALKEACGSWYGACSAPFAFLCTIRSISPAAATAIRSRSVEQVHEVLHRAEVQGARVLVPDDGEYPESLRSIEHPPSILFALGRLELLAADAAAIVGTRHPTTYGLGVTRAVARTAAQAGLVVVSGMARGLDAVAHWAALDAGGGTIGVLGNGLGVVYPAANAALYRRVAADGLLLTEYPPGERPNAGSFPRRNRLISGLARVTVVIEAAAKSGALITSDAALDQGRQVLAVPGPLTSRLSEGTNRLIRDGAGPWLEAEDLLSRYPSVSRAVRERFRAEADRDPRQAQLDYEQRRVFEILDGVPREPDAIADELGLSVQEVLAAVTELELAGLADRVPTGFVRA